MKNTINDKQITFLIRGRYCGHHPAFRNSVTFKLIRSLENFYPGSNIIFSTWDNFRYIEEIKIQHPKAQLVLSQEIEGQNLEFGVDPKKEYKNSINSQLLCIGNGLTKVKTKYVCIVRSDFYFNNDNLKKLYQEHLKHNYDKEFRIFETPILIPFWGSVNSYKNPISRTPNFPFHPSDMFHFGLTKDLKSYFDTPLMSNEDLQYFLHHPRGTSKNLKIYDSGYLCRYLPEQYIFVSFLKRKGILSQSEFINMEDSPDKYKKLSHKLIINNFFMVNFRELGASIQTPTNLRLHCLPIKFFNGRAIILSSLRFHLSRYGFLSRRVSYPRKIILSLKHGTLSIIETPFGLICSLKNLLNLRYKIKKFLTKIIVSK